MILRAKDSGDFVAASLTAVMIAGLIYVGVLFLNTAEQPENVTTVDGAIRIAQPRKDTPIEPLEQKRFDKPSPPEALPRVFTSKARPDTVKPLVSLAIPNFSSNIHPSLNEGPAMPAGDLGGIGFSMDEVDEIPRVIRKVPPEYPYGARRNQIEGEVVIRMLVTRKGTPTNISINSSTPPEVFDTAALSAAKRWNFTPGHYKGQAVDTWVLIPFNFKLTR
ncbi:energy transducer TonB [Pseudodesulfovibrio sediminis]|uniref:TonB C-terminal domain-containing protein n=1 Tax=Pseudodesulfovibrio sediminis TaxID=2810563 RepID=A0ABN6EN80_9BACT|nr:energy transducer TonB [Pseudodesulfovibrio sediminis]BCS87638.1 hypothetical protein PSDVSF_08800 [Pseudodesulfovibrio sediminis]